jgi:hypothetical protein
MSWQIVQINDSSMPSILTVSFRSLASQDVPALAFWANTSPLSFTSDCSNDDESLVVSAPAQASVSPAGDAICSSAAELLFSAVLSLAD